MTAAPDRRIAFLDVDGTLIDAGEFIAPSTIEAVRGARANGHLVYLCTGRASSEIYPAIRDIGFDGAISAGGGFAEVGKDLVISRTMTEDAVERMIGYFETVGYDFYLQTYGTVYPSPGLYERFAAALEAERRGRSDANGATSVIEGGVHPALRAFADVRPYETTGIAKSVFAAADITAFDRVSEAFAGEFHVITGTIPHLGRGSGEVTLAGVNKGSTIAQLLEHLGLDISASIGIGDSYNDLEMLEMCGVGIAMGNADDFVKSHADETTTSVLDDGVWNAFRRHGLI
jgi:Cof subfamily protein (haloacid dehalogenase superfamily)